MSFGRNSGAVRSLTERERAELAAWIPGSSPPDAGEDAMEESITEAERREAEMDAGVTKPLTEAELWEAVNRERSKWG